LMELHVDTAGTQINMETHINAGRGHVNAAEAPR